MHARLQVLRIRYGSLVPYLTTSCPRTTPGDELTRDQSTRGIDPGWSSALRRLRAAVLFRIVVSYPFSFLPPQPPALLTDARLTFGCLRPVRSRLFSFGPGSPPPTTPIQAYHWWPGDTVRMVD
jgi:hypothetical protein